MKWNLEMIIFFTFYAGILCLIYRGIYFALKDLDKPDKLTKFILKHYENKESKKNKNENKNKNGNNKPSN